VKAKLFILGLMAIGIAACSKDQYTTKPQISFKSVNSTTFAKPSLLNFKVEFTDKEGDIQDTLWIQKLSFKCADGNFVAPYPVPSFPATKDLKGEFDISFVYGLADAGYPAVPGCSQRDDSCYFKFWLKDKANHVSDTISSPILILLK
jgi:hypothetical protein